MTTDEAKEIYGTIRALAEALGITEQAVYQWGGEVPDLRVYQIQVKAKEKEASK